MHITLYLCVNLPPPASISLGDWGINNLDNTFKCFGGTLLGDAPYAWCPALGKKCYTCAAGPGGYYVNVEGSSTIYHCWSAAGYDPWCDPAMMTAGGECNVVGTVTYSW